jgi:predicted neuraminidase
MKITNRKFLNVNTNSCHASTLAFHRGEPVFAWFGGIREGLPDSNIYIQYRDNIYIYDNFAELDLPKWNPILYSINDKLFLFIKVGRFCDCWQTFIYDITNLDDLNRINNLPFQVLPAGLHGPVKTCPIEHDGYIYMGSSVETFYNWSSYIEKYKLIDNEFKFIDISKPLGNQTIQPSLWVNKHDVLRAVFRSKENYDGNMYVHTSTLNSSYWIEPYTTNFLNPNSGIDTVYTNDNLYLVHNPSGSRFRRDPLILSKVDEDFNIKDELIISEKAECSNTDEVSYPFMIEHGGKLHLTYTYGRSKIEYVEIEL